MTNLGKQIDELANFIMEEIKGEPSGSMGAVECAVKIMRQQKKRIAEVEAERDSETRWAKEYHNQAIERAKRIAELEGERDRWRDDYNRVSGWREEEIKRIAELEKMLRLVVLQTQSAYPELAKVWASVLKPRGGVMGEHKPKAYVVDNTSGVPRLWIEQREYEGLRKRIRELNQDLDEMRADLRTVSQVYLAHMDTAKATRIARRAAK